MISFQISIFEPLETAELNAEAENDKLWLAFKLVSLNHWKQPNKATAPCAAVVISFQISIFEPLETANYLLLVLACQLWLAFKLVSLNHWKQQVYKNLTRKIVVISFQISIFEPLETAWSETAEGRRKLWLAFKLVSLNHWKQRNAPIVRVVLSCD